MAVAVALADDNLIVREGIAELLVDDENIEVVGLCADLGSLIELVDEREPDVVVTDIRMPPTHTDEGIRLAALLRQSHPEIGVVVLSNYANPVYALALLQSGSEGRSSLLKEPVHDRAQLVPAIPSVGAGSCGGTPPVPVGGRVRNPKMVEPLIAARTHGERSPLADLTPRERAV